jgi:hypothetical protein
MAVASPLPTLSAPVSNKGHAATVAMILNPETFEADG